MSLLHKTRHLTQKIWDVKSPRIVFVHVPKCGGSSIYEAISKSMGLKYPDGHLDPVWSRTIVGEIYNSSKPELSSELQIFRHALLANYLNDKKRFIAGHFTVNEVLVQRMKTNYRLVTLLRKPDKRLFSHFKYWMLTRDLAKDKDAVYKHWKEYVNSDKAKFQANLFSIYFGEANFQKIEKTSIEKALHSLGKLDLVGDLGDLEAFEKSLSQILGKKTKIGFANTSKNLMEDDELNQAFSQLFNDEYEVIQGIVKTDDIIYKSFFNKRS